MISFKKHHMKKS